MGAPMSVRKLLPLLCLLVLCGCTYQKDMPYVYITEGVYATSDRVWDNGVVRERQVTDKQALQYITDDNGVDLQKGELVFYHGTLYSLSNYRAYLLAEGYVVESETRTSDLLDTILSKDSQRVRLIYQKSGTIRIIED